MQKLTGSRPDFNQLPCLHIKKHTPFPRYGDVKVAQIPLNVSPGQKGWHHHTSMPEASCCTEEGSWTRMSGIFEKGHSVQRPARLHLMTMMMRPRKMKTPAVVSATCMNPPPASLSAPRVRVDKGGRVPVLILA